MKAATRWSAYPVRASYHARMATNAQHQASYRARQVSEGYVRLDTHISADAHTALDHVAQREGCTRKDAIELAILNEAKGR